MYAIIYKKLRRNEMPLSENAKRNKNKYIMEYAKSTYKRVPLDVTHEKYSEIKKAADSQNETVNGFIKKAIDDRLNSL